jgi:hypothetical protein
MSNKVGRKAGSKSSDVVNDGTAAGHLTWMIEKEAARPEPDQSKIMRWQLTLDDVREDSVATLRTILDSLRNHQR